jgi:thiosulfate dehydrogenase
MAKTRTASRSRSSGSIGKLLLGMVIGCALFLVAIVLYFRYGNPPVAVTDSNALWEPLVESVPLHTRSRAAIKTAPFAASEDVFEAAARTYRAQCISCHGSPGHDVTIGRTMMPPAPQFFSPRDRKATSAQQPGELYWKTAFGIRRSGMPAYSHVLTDTQMWQLALLLHSAADELPDPVHALLVQGDPPPQPTVVKP